MSSDLRMIGQVGSTVCIGLLLDTLIVRFVRRAAHPQNPRAVVLVADTGAFPSVTAGIRHVRLSELRRSDRQFCPTANPQPRGQLQPAGHAVA
jgi:hypothetical protein